jgi:esterase/lipase superfamily enzyme
MRRDYHNWYSHRVGRNMELLVYGEGGTPVLVFPTSRGRFYEYENAGMIHAIWREIEAGHLQVFCVDSFDNESWYNRGIHPHDRVMRHLAFEDYIVYEVLPLMSGLSGASQISTTGCSLGGYHALNFALKHPDLTAKCVAMSGCFDMKRFMDGYYDQDFYFNNPPDYVPNVQDSWFLERYQKMRLILAAGDHDICLGENYRMAEILGNRGIPHWLDVWTGGEQHDWPLWQRMAVKFFTT